MKRALLLLVLQKEKLHLQQYLKYTYRLSKGRIVIFSMCSSFYLEMALTLIDCYARKLLEKFIVILHLLDLKSITVYVWLFLLAAVYIYVIELKWVY